MSHPLIDRLSRELGWPRLSTMPAWEVFTRSPGAHVVFVPGDPARNLESADVAVILPELARTFGGRFDCAVLAPGLEETVRAATGVFKTPSLIFFRDGRQLGDIQKVRDWDDYVTRTTQILSVPQMAE